MNYSFAITLKKMVKYFVIFAIPFLVNLFIINFPEIAQITVGALLVGLANFLKVKAEISWL